MGIVRLLAARGVVLVDVQLDQLDMNQCPQDYFVPNAFKDTARCHYETTYVSTFPLIEFFTQVLSVQGSLRIYLNGHVIVAPFMAFTVGCEMWKSTVLANAFVEQQG